MCDEEWVTTATNLQSFPEAVDESLEEWLVVGNGLQDVSICSDIADGPLAQPCTAESENVAEVQNKAVLCYSTGQDSSVCASRNKEWHG